ncbi:CDGSH iron-sulfur domain-containing protein [Dermatobacter hominis]|uniref:CDGSH iron-sulfur domain-containing protein n=1 Tax=Dermatobacter hominis TaxID=2884263 RepID=UPI001D100A17|nr:CDGSH iron-sulfur domain-containing protein [Dermatobacter hominis]UDY36826.1 (4Fe-4S)-binding protein [Dermatobacter hominis]
MAAKDYRAEGITVHWRSARCIHSLNCVTALPEVFDRDARPWIRAGAAPADVVAAAVDGCPSRALTYTRTDGAAPGPGAARDDEDAPTSDGTAVRVNVKPNGPLAIVGVVEVVDGEGNVLSVDDRTFLCRCGGSATKPFCDGTHKRNSFQG